MKRKRTLHEPTRIDPNLFVLHDLSADDLAAGTMIDSPFAGADVWMSRTSYLPKPYHDLSITEMHHAKKT